MTNYGRVTQVVEKRVSKESATSPSQGGGGRVLSVSQIFGTSYMCAHSVRNNNQILHDDQTTCDHEC